MNIQCVVSYVFSHGLLDPSELCQRLLWFSIRVLLLTFRTVVTRGVYEIWNCLVESFLHSYLFTAHQYIRTKNKANPLSSRRGILGDGNVSFLVFPDT